MSQSWKVAKDKEENDSMVLFLGEKDRGYFSLCKDGEGFILLINWDDELKVFSGNAMTFDMALAEIFKRTKPEKMPGIIKEKEK